MKPTMLCLLALTLTSPAAARISVVATTADLGALAREVGGDAVEVLVLASPAEDPHYVDPRPSFLLALRGADLLVKAGLELEVGWLPNLLAGARNGRIQVGGSGHFDASAFVSKLDVPARVDRAMGDIHAGGNPHFALDPRQMAKVARAMGARLGELDPRSEAAFRARASDVAQALEALAGREARRFALLPESSRGVVSYHQSLGYLYAWLGLEEVATIEPRPGVKPSPSRVHTVMKEMQARGARVIVQEGFYPSKLSRTIAGLVGGRVVKLPGATDFPAGQTYGEHIAAVAKQVHHALTH